MVTSERPLTLVKAVTSARWVALSPSNPRQDLLPQAKPARAWWEAEHLAPVAWALSPQPAQAPEQAAKSLKGLALVPPSLCLRHSYSRLV